MSGEKDKNGGMWLKSLKGALLASALSVALVAAFAFVLLKEWLPIESVSAVNAFVKIVCAAAASLVTIRGGVKRAWLWGSLSGALYMLLAMTVFALISGEFSFGTGNLLDILICLLAGCVTAMIKNLVRR